MNRTGWLIGGVLLFVALGAWLFLGGDVDGGTARPSLAETSGGAAAGDANLAEVTDDEVELTIPETVGDERTALDDKTVTGAGPAIEGRVAFPLGSPPDDSLEVLAFLGEEEVLLQSVPTDVEEPHGWEAVRFDGRRPAHRAAVDANGGFRLELPVSARRALLLLDGRFLYLHRGALVELPATAPVLLDAELGGCLRVRCVPPAGESEASSPLADLQLEAHGYLPRAVFSFDGLPIRTARTGDDLIVEFRALSVRYDWFVLGDPPRYAASRDLGIELEAGKVHERDLTFALGMDYAGRVVDQEGEGLGAALVSVEPPQRVMGFGPGTRRETLTNDAGAFEILGARVGPVVVTAEREGYVTARSEQLWGTAGEARGDLELVLRRGESIAGTVVSPAGELVPNALVELAPPERQEGAWREQRTDDDGRFLFLGLEEGEFDLVAAAGTEAAPLRARRAAIAAGTLDVELQLRATSRLRGTVVGESDEPIPAAELTFWPRGREEEQIAVTVDDPGGRFEAEGFYPGAWHVDAIATGWLPPEEGVTFGVPLEEDELKVTLIRAARVRGTAIDSVGAPVASAVITLTEAGTEEVGRAGTAYAVKSADTRCDDEGRFTFESLRPGLYEIGADHDSLAPSEALPLELAPGADLSDLELVLFDGGMIVGEIYTPDGEPERGRTISARSADARDAGETISGSDGSFELGPLGAGVYSVTAKPTQEELAPFLKGEGDITALANLRRTQEVAVVEGETTPVVLGAPPAQPILVYGTVAKNGAPVTSGAVTIFREGEGHGGRASCDVQGDGTYELTIDGGGTVVAVYQTRLYAGDPVDRAVRIPSGVEEFRIDFAIPTGAIEGVVLDHEGNAIPKVVLTLNRDSGLKPVRSHGPVRGTSTRDDGTFTMAELRPGTYSLRVGGMLFGMKAPIWGAGLAEGIVVAAGGTTGGVEIRLGPPGTLTGRVVDLAGEAVAGAILYARDGQGRRLQTLSSVETDQTGRFLYEGLPAGEVLVTAQATGGSTRIAGPFEIVAGEETEVELLLEEGTLLHVAIEDGEGRPLRARVHVFDDAGRDHSDLESIPAILSGAGDTGPRSAQRFGPLPPGTYRLVAESETGAMQEREAVLAGEAEAEVRLVFDE